MISSDLPWNQSIWSLAKSYYTTQSPQWHVTGLSDETKAGGLNACAVCAVEGITSIHVTTDRALVMTLVNYASNNNIVNNIMAYGIQKARSTSSHRD
jgi:hypothetical protein